MLKSPFLLALILALMANGAVASQTPTPNNPYGAHLFIQDAMSPENIEKHTTWARSLVGKDGYCKLFLYPITEAGDPDTEFRLPSWKQAVQACYDKEMTPIVRLGGRMKDGIWQKPSDFSRTAQAIKDVVSQLPRSGKYPLIVEVFNEPNLHIEWSGKTEPVEYARFFVEASKAIRSLNDARIVIANGALSPGGDFNNVEFVREVCRKVPEFVDAFDVWASHCYPCCPPEENIHDGTKPRGSHTLDLYLDELAVLEQFGRKGLKVIISETSYNLGPEGEDARSDKMMRAFRDYWGRWPEVLAVTPYAFCCPWGGMENVDWVHNDSGTTPDGLPNRPYGQYTWVADLAKPTDSHGTVSGKVTERDFGSPLEGAEVTLNPGGVKTSTNSAGNFMFPRLRPGAYTVDVSAKHYETPTAARLAVSAGTNAVADFSLATTSKVTIRGTILDSTTGGPVNGVMVTTAPGGFKATTDETGRYEFVGIPPATYTLKSEKQGHLPFDAGSVVLRPDQSKTADWYTAPGPTRPRSLIASSEMEGPEGASVANGWTTADGKPHPEIFSVDYSVRYCGRASQRISPAGSEVNYVWGISDYNAPETGKRYRIDVWCRTDDAEGQVKAVGKFVSNSLEPSGEFELKPVLEGTNGWTLLSGTGIAPAFGSLKEDSGRFQVLLIAELKKGTAWFDSLWAGEDTE